VAAGTAPIFRHDAEATTGTRLNSEHLAFWLGNAGHYLHGWGEWFDVSSDPHPT